MGKKDARVDAYIGKSADFAKPILKHLRQLVHAACPDAEEALKWGMPHFTHQGNLCHMAAFKQHCAFGFWRHKLIVGDGVNAEAMGQFGRITTLADLPSDKALVTFEGFSPSHQREYVEWITEAKREETRQARMKTALEWLAQGKARNWKYMNC